MTTDMRLDFGAKRFNRSVAFFFLLFHIGAVIALFHFTWGAFLSAVLLWWISGSLGIGIGYHRLLTHRGFKTPKWVEYVLTTCGALAFEGGPIPWVATHRVHHANTEKEGDPHSPRDGFWWSHMGWMLSGQSMHRDIQITSRHASDLARDRFHSALTEWHFIPQIVVALLLYGFGGWPYVLWGVFVRVVFSWHATWFVNSASHVWGGRRFDTRDDSRNNWWVALMTFGEGWHNNHHAHPSAARHGLVWYEIDVNWYGIWVLQKLGLITNLRLAELRPQESNKMKAAA